MAKRSAEGDLATPSKVPLVPEAEAFPAKLVPVDTDAFVPLGGYVATHIHSNGVAIFETGTEAVVANVIDGIIFHHFDLTTSDMLGILADPETGRSAVCIGQGDTVAVILAEIGGETVFGEKMLEGVCGGDIVVSGAMFVAVNVDRVVLVCPFVTCAVQHAWVAPAPVGHIVRCRTGPPVLVLTNRTTWRPRLGADGVAFEPIDLEVWNPFEATNFDTETGVAVVREAAGMASVLVSRAFPHFADVRCPVTPVAAAWEGRWIFVLGEADTVSHSPEVWAVNPSIGSSVGTFHPERLRFHLDDSLAEYNTISGKIVLWYGSVYLLC